MYKVKIVVPGLCADDIYEIIKQSLESYGYVINSVEQGCSTGPNGFLERHSGCQNCPKVLEKPLAVDLIVDEQPWGG